MIRNGNGGLTLKIVVSIFTAAVLGLGGWALTSLVGAQQRITSLEVRQDQTDRIIDAMAQKISEIHEWVLRQQGSRR